MTHIQLEPIPVTGLETQQNTNGPTIISRTGVR